MKTLNIENNDERIEEKNKQERDQVMRPKILNLIKDLKQRFSI